MPGQRIYYVPPRLVGSVQNWSGMEAQDGKSWLVEQAKDLGFNAIWFSPMTETTAVEKLSHGKKVGGSYYAIRDHFSLDAEFSAGAGKAKDEAHLKHFCKTAQDSGVRVYADLVFNHVAADHALVAEETAAISDIMKKTNWVAQAITAENGSLVGISYEDEGNKENSFIKERKSFYFKFKRNNDLTLKVGGAPDDPWSDVAQINYASPEARRFFVGGDADNKAYFKKVIDWFSDMGFTGFRCDVAYMIPSDVWQNLISYAKEKQPDSIFLGETLGGPDAAIEKMADIKIGKLGVEKPGFDFGMLSTYWWDYESKWLFEVEHPRIKAMSKFGGAASPDNHDTAATLAGSMSAIFNDSAKKDEIVSKICVRNYALSVLACSASYMQMGFEFCKEKQNSVFRGDTTAVDWDDVSARTGSTLDISARIREINLLKEDLHVENCCVNFKECAQVEGGKMVKIHVEYIDVDTDKKTAEIVLLLNKKPENGPVSVTEQELLSLDSSGLDKKGDTTLVNDVVIYHTPVQPSAPKAAYKARAQKFKP